MPRPARHCGQNASVVLIRLLGDPTAMIVSFIFVALKHQDIKNWCVQVNDPVYGFLSPPSRTY